MIHKFLMLIVLLTVTTTQNTCDYIPTYYNSPDGKQHLYERPPSENKEALYCIVHETIEMVYRLTPDIQDVEGNQDIVHQIYNKLDDIDKETMKFAHKLGDFEESGYVVKIKIARDGEFEEQVYFVVPQEGMDN